VLVVNPTTQIRVEAIAEAAAAWRPGDADIRLRFTTPEIGADEIAREERTNADIIVAVGGDGTVGEVASAIAHTDVLLGIIPCGSTNMVARELGIPTSPAAALDLITSGTFDVATLDIGWVGERALVHMAGCGFDSQMFAGTNPRLKRRLGWLAYLPAAIRALPGNPTRFLVVADGEQIRVTSPLILVANGGSLITPRWRIHPHPRQDDGVLDLIIITATGFGQILATFGRALLGQLDRSPFALHRPVRHVRIESEKPVPFQSDGDVTAMTPVTISVDPAALRIIVPKRIQKP
jgi:YegS/Rv2252/BmrU family lipid kinase